MAEGVAGLGEGVISDEVLDDWRMGEFSQLLAKENNHPNPNPNPHPHPNPNPNPDPDPNPNQERGRRGKKVFFHISVAAEGWSPQQGDATVRVRVRVSGRPSRVKG